MGINFDFDPERRYSIVFFLISPVPDGFVDEDSSMLGGNFGCELS